MAVLNRGESLTSSFRRSFYKSNTHPASVKRVASMHIPKSESLTSLHTKLDFLLPSGNAEIGINVADSTENKVVNILQIKRTHWKDITKAQSCERCRKSLGFASKKHNCHRCGYIFCDTCCQYRKRLSPDCVPDPQGNIYRVCYSCADLNTQPLGKIQSLTESFQEQRKNKRVNISDELHRLIVGFEQNVDPSSPLKSVVRDSFSLKVPDWQKSKKWMESSEVEWCMKCSAKFNLFSLKHHCRLCGCVCCMKCCNSKLLLYFDKHGKSCAKLIGVVGCPDKEPAVYLYCNLCTFCEGDLEEYQVHHYYHQQLNPNPVLKNNVKELEITLEQLKTIENKLDESLTRFHEQLETYIFEGNPEENIDGQNNVELFAKAYVDIGELLTRFATIIYGLKQLVAASAIEMTIIKNMISIKYKQYSGGMDLFKSLKFTVDKSFPPKALLRFQNYANIQAINNTCVMTRQLGLEALNLSMRYGFDSSIAEKLREVDHVCYSELEEYLLTTGENKSEHLAVLSDLLKLQLKEKKLVIIDASLAVKEGSTYVRPLLLQRCSSVLYQILKSLNAKSSETQFSKSKECLQLLLSDGMEPITKSPSC